MTCVGSDGASGTSGWHFSFDGGVPRYSEIFLQQVPRGHFFYASMRIPKNSNLELWQRARWEACADMEITESKTAGGMMVNAAGLKYHVRR